MMYRSMPITPFATCRQHCATYQAPVIHAQARRSMIRPRYYPIRSPDVDWACVDIKGIQGATGHVGLDPVMGDCANRRMLFAWKQSYRPILRRLRYVEFRLQFLLQGASFGNGGNDFPFGIFINNADKNYCVDAPWCRESEILAHNWANRISAVHLEIYSHDERYRGASIWADDFSHLPWRPAWLDLTPAR